MDLGIASVTSIVIIVYLIGQVVKATPLDNKWIPVVDWENYRLPHSEDVPVNGTCNAWEYYWKQPSLYTLEEVYRSKHVILSNMNIPSGYLPHLRTPENGLEAYAKRIVKLGTRYAKMISFNDYVQGYIEFVFLKGDINLIINDDGKDRLPLNEKATEIAHNEAAIYPRDYICGDAVLCKDWEA